MLVVVIGLFKVTKSLYSKQRSSHKIKEEGVIHFLFCNFSSALLCIFHDTWGQVLQVRGGSMAQVDT